MCTNCLNQLYPALKDSKGSHECQGRQIHTMSRIKSGWSTTLLSNGHGKEYAQVVKDHHFPALAHTSQWEQIPELAMVLVFQM